MAVISNGGDVSDWLEFHDSTLSAFDARETQVDLLLDAYIHRWETLNDGWTGTGWKQSVRITVSDAIAIPAFPLLPVGISDGRLQLDTMPPHAVVRLPLRAFGVVRIWLQLITADIVELTGTAVCIAATAPARYVEALPVDLRPQDP